MKQEVVAPIPVDIEEIHNNRKERKKRKKALAERYEVTPLLKFLKEKIFISDNQLAIAAGVSPTQVGRYYDKGIAYEDHIEKFADMLGTTREEFDQYYKGKISMSEMVSKSLAKLEQEENSNKKKLLEQIMIESILLEVNKMSTKGKRDIMKELVGMHVDALSLPETEEEYMYKDYPEIISFGWLSTKLFFPLERFHKVFEAIIKATEKDYFLKHGCDPHIHRHFMELGHLHLAATAWDFWKFESLVRLLPRISDWDQETPIFVYSQTYKNDLDQLIYDIIEPEAHSHISKIVNELIYHNKIDQIHINKALELCPMTLKRWRQIRIGYRGEDSLLKIEIKPITEYELRQVAFICKDFNYRLGKEASTNVLSNTNSI